MESFILVLIPCVVIVLYILIFSRKEEFIQVKRSWRQYDWLTFFSAVISGVLFSSAMRAADISFPGVPLLIILTSVLIIFVVVALIRRARTGRPIIKRMGDERTEMIMAKSARNAFFATYLTLFVNLVRSDDVVPDATGLMIMLSSGLLVLVVSLLIYYDQRS